MDKNLLWFSKGGGMMERLTIDEVIEHCKRTTAKYENLNGINKLETADISFVHVKEYWEHRQVKEYLEELKRYRDLEEQGLLFRLPCNEGDTVYAIDGKNIQTLEAKNDIALISGKVCIFAENCHYADYISYDMIGKTVFLTQAEAEQKLKEMESK